MMAQILIRGLDSKVVERLKKRARQHGRSLQAETRQILRDVSGWLDREELMAELDRFRAMTAGQESSDSAELIREMREEE